MLAIFQDLDPVDENMFYTNGILLRLFEGGDIRDRSRVEDHHVGEHTLLQKAPMVQLKIRRRKPRQSPNGLCEGDDVLLADIFTRRRLPRVTR